MFLSSFFLPKALDLIDHRCTHATRANKQTDNESDVVNICCQFGRTKSGIFTVNTTILVQ